MTLALGCGPSEEKYVVTKDGVVLAPGTYFVVRASDFCAPAGLWAYANTMQTVLELNDTTGMLTEAEAANIKATSDKATELASTWQKLGLGRVPD